MQALGLQWLVTPACVLEFMETLWHLISSQMSDKGFLLLFLKFFFPLWTIFEVFIEFVTILLLSYVLLFLARKHVGSSLPNQGLNPSTSCIGRWSLNHWTTRKVPGRGFLFLFFFPIWLLCLLLLGNLGRSKSIFKASQVKLVVKNPPATQEV